ncbi:cation efflux family-domain-containing protein [Coprinopsis sp. MPI-PUGE-AT-0042]|nr:cation efflux family-domain-containing protein [Coprinopsis sp. MPI-PUGE-AT-0042]
MENEAPRSYKAVAFYDGLLAFGAALGPRVIPDGNSLDVNSNMRHTTLFSPASSPRLLFVLPSSKPLRASATSFLPPPLTSNMKNTTRIGIVLLVSFAFFVVEIVIGFRTKSLALIADAFHYLNVSTASVLSLFDTIVTHACGTFLRQDIVAYIIAFIAAWLQERRQHTHDFTFAFHRAELVGAFFNGVFLLALALSIFLQSIERFVHVEEVQSPKLILIVGCIGLGLNLISILVVHDHHGHSHSHGPVDDRVSESAIAVTLVGDRSESIHAAHNHARDPPSDAGSHRNLGLVGVLIHILGDAVNNIGVIVVAILIWKLESPARFYADPAISLAIALVIFASAVPLTMRSGRILLEATPLHLDLSKIKDDLVTLPLVNSVHDLHVWHLSQSVILASLHVCIPAETTLAEWEKTEQSLQHCFTEYGIRHVTISPEIYRDRSSTVSTSEEAAGGCSLPSQDEYGCSFNSLKQRRVGTV